MAARLNWLIFGAGAIGTYTGGSLILHGHKVVFVDQPEAVAEIIEHGLKLNLHGQEHRLLQPVIYTTLPGAISHTTFDVAIFALKSYDTRFVLDSMRPFVDRIPPILCLQNGVENEPALETIFSSDKVIAGTVTSSVGRRAAGDIVLERQRGIGIEHAHSLSSTLVQALSEAGLNAHLYSSRQAMKWSKMLTNLLANASSAILDMTPAEILQHPGLYKVEIAQLREALSVMHAHRIPTIDLPGIPVRLFTWVVNQLPLWLSRPLISQYAGRGRGQKMPSFHIDLYSGRGNTEVDYLNGAVVRFGTRVDVPTPVNQWLNQTVEDLTQGKLPLDTYAHQPDKYLQELSSYL